MLIERGDEQQFRCQIAIALTRDLRTEEWFVDRVEFDLVGARNTTTFTHPVPLDRALSADFLSEIRAYLPDATDSKVFVDGKAVIQTPRLVLGGIRVIAQTARCGVQQVVIRFKKALGTLQSILLPKYRTEENTRENLDRAAAEALLYLLRPCLDLANVDPETVTEGTVGEQVSQRLLMLAEQKDDLAFFVYLLKRFVENAPSAEIARGAPPRDGALSLAKPAATPG